MKILVIGLGYVGQAFCSQYGDSQVIQTASRSDKADIHFDFMDESTWGNLQPAEAALITFPLKPLEQSQKFYEFCKSKFENLVVIGTTGSIKTEYPNQVVNEDSEFDDSQERVQSENYFLKHGANIIHSAGIYGVGRDPRAWVMKGLVGPEERYVNFIHVEDLCQFILSAFKSKEFGQRYIASDGNPQKWSELIKSWIREYNLVLPRDYKKSKRPSKKIDPTWSLEKLNIQLKYKSVNEGLWQIGF